jgi:hypothetical protein
LAVRYENAWLRITDEAVEARGRAYALAEVQGLEETGFWGARIALLASLVMVAVVAGAMGDGWMLYAFVGCWGLLAALLTYASFALKGLRLRTPGRARTLPGRFSRSERRRIAAAFADAKAADR